MTTETYTAKELDELSGSLLFLGRIHNCIASFLDATAELGDTSLIELVNHAPASMVMEILPATSMLLAEVSARIDELQGATGAAIDSCAERVKLAGNDTAATDDAFASIIDIEFAKYRKKNGG